MKGDIAPIGVAILISRHGGHVTHTAWEASTRHHRYRTGYCGFKRYHKDIYRQSTQYREIFIDINRGGSYGHKDKTRKLRIIETAVIIKFATASRVHGPIWPS